MNNDLRDAVYNFMFFLANMATYSKHQLKQSIISPEKIHFISGADDPLLNGLCTLQQDEAALLEHLQAFPKNIKEYYLWWPYDYLSDESLEDHSLMETSRLLCLAGEIDELLTYPIPPAIEIRQVDSEESYKLFMDIFMEGFGIPKHLYEDYYLMFRFYQNEPQLLYHFVAYYEGKPAATVSVMKHDEVVGMYTGTTLAAFKNKGILIAFYTRMIEMMPQFDAKKMVYQSKQPILIENIKKRFGFRTVGQLTAYKIRS